MQYNRTAINLREGKIFLDGVEIFDGVKADVKFTPDVYTGRQLGDITPSSQWLGGAITVSVTRRRSTPWLKDTIKKYLNDKATPEFTIQGIMEDTNSDYYANYGSDTVTCVGCVPTGDIILLSLDADGQVLDDPITFNAKEVV